MSVSRPIQIGSIVVYRGDKRLPEWHDRGFQPQLPAIVTKVWSSGVANLRVAAGHSIEDGKVDLRVFLDHNAKDRDAYVWVFGAKYSESGELDTWSWPVEVQS